MEVMGTEPWTEAKVIDIKESKTIQLCLSFSIILGLPDASKVISVIFISNVTIINNKNNTQICILNSVIFVNKYC